MVPRMRRSRLAMWNRNRNSLLHDGTVGTLALTTNTTQMEANVPGRRRLGLGLPSLRIRKHSLAPLTIVQSHTRVWVPFLVSPIIDSPDPRLLELQSRIKSLSMTDMTPLELLYAGHQRVIHGDAPLFKCLNRDCDWASPYLCSLQRHMGTSACGRR